MADLHLGELVDPATHERNGTGVTVDTADLTTHGVIVGMTGSGKTGLGVVLIEEALSNDVPCLLIDPKGDLTNLCLVFPGLGAADFRPWIDESQAKQAGATPDDFAAQQAETWKKGLASWGIEPARLQSLVDGVDFTIYTPGSTSGAPVNIVGSLQAPGDAADLETMRDEIDGYVSGLLGLVGIDADPLSSREHILLANLIETSWTAGRSLDLATLVGEVQSPPIRKLGVFELDSFFPAKDRTAFALKLNSLLASPSFGAWSAGPPLDISALLRTPDGTPRAAIISIGHLSDEERQFVVALVLSKVVTWMRRQTGTTDLRALVYMDEVAGYVPPTANPPTKKPILTLLKQARAFGVGTVLSTQNPVDIDYKGTSNAGTWMIGRLQTERDKGRLLDGMSAAAGGVDVKAVGDTISGLGKREFVLRRAGKDKPDVFTTRWAMSYLRGPLTRDQIATLMAGRAAPAPPASTPGAPLPPPPPPGATVPAPAAVAAVAPAAAAAADESTVMPTVAQGIGIRYLSPSAPWAVTVGAVPNGNRLQATAVARVHLRYDDEKADLVVDEEWEGHGGAPDEVRDQGQAAAGSADDGQGAGRPVLRRRSVGSQRRPALDGGQPARQLPGRQERHPVARPPDVPVAGRDVQPAPGVHGPEARRRHREAHDAPAGRRRSRGAASRRDRRHRPGVGRQGRRRRDRPRAAREDRRRRIQPRPAVAARGLILPVLASLRCRKARLVSSEPIRWQGRGPRSARLRPLRGGRGRGRRPGTRGRRGRPPRAGPRPSTWRGGPTARRWWWP
jgi:hypothetical protein